MSYTMLIADDEYFIRQRLKKLLPWQALDIELVADVEDGVQCIDVLRRQNIDILLLDIQMPKADGLAVCQHIQQQGLETIVMMLSGHDEFEYAQAALRHGVIDYLLKPVAKKRLITATTKACQHVDQIRNTHHINQSLVHYELAEAIAQWFAQHMATSDFYARFSFLRAHQYRQTIAIYHDGALTLEQLKQLSDMTCEAVIIRSRESDYVILLHAFFKQSTASTQLIAHVSELQHDSSCYTFIVCGELYENDDIWRHSQRIVVDALNWRYFVNVDIIAAANYPPTDQPTEKFVSIATVVDDLTRLINQKNPQSLRAYLDSLFIELAELRSHTLLMSAISEILLSFRQHHCFLSDLQNQQVFANAVLEETHQLCDIVEILYELGTQCLTSEKHAPSDVRLAEQIANYIDSNYGEHSLNVSAIAASLSLNASYINSVFRKVHQQTILQYITNTRLRQANALLAREQHKIQDVAKLVGYDDAYYFSKRYKKHFGQSPSEFLNTLATARTFSAEQTDKLYSD